MKALAICNKGIEEAVDLELKELIGSSSRSFSGHVTFSIEKKEELCEVSYLSQSITKTLLLLDEFDFDSLEDILKKAEKIDLSGWLNENRSFKVDSKIIQSDITSEKLNGKVGAKIIGSIKTHTQKVDLEDPDVVIFVFIDKNKAFFGIDFSGKDLSKREYRIFSSAKNIKSTIAYAMLRLSDYKKGETLLDPFCISGSIPIETALYENNFPPNYFEKDRLLFTKIIDFDFKDIDDGISKDRGNIYAYDAQFRNINSAKKNSKIAGIHKAINFSRMEVGWLDTKFDKNSIDRIVTCLPNLTKYSDRKSILKIYKEFFYQAEFVLKTQGTILICTRNPEQIIEIAKEKGFTLKENLTVWQGKQKMTFLKFTFPAV